MENDKRIYEFGFILSGLLPEDGVLSLQEKIENIFKSFEGKIREKSEPGRKILSYPINKQGEGYFTYFHVDLDPEKLEELKEKLKYEADILRYLCLIISTNLDKIEEKKIKAPRPSKEKIKSAPLVEEPASEIDLEALDHKLDEIKELS